MVQSDARYTRDPAQRPHAFDPVARPELFEGVLGRRIFAFLVDFAIICVLWVVACILLFFLGILTLGLAWLLYGAVFPIVALGYNAWTLSRPPSATIGMRLMGLEMRMWYGDRMSAIVAAFHALLYYFSVTILTPLILLVPLFNDRKRCLHDYLAGTVIINSDVRI